MGEEEIKQWIRFNPYLAEGPARWWEARGKNEESPQYNQAWGDFSKGEFARYELQVVRVVGTWRLVHGGNPEGEGVETEWHKPGAPGPDPEELEEMSWDLEGAPER